MNLLNQQLISNYGKNTSGKKKENESTRGRQIDRYIYTVPASSSLALASLSLATNLYSP